MSIACWITKATQEFTVYTRNSYSFTAATIVARARPDFHILVLPFAVYRKRKINEQYVVSKVHNSLYGWPLQLLAPGTKNYLCHWSYINQLNLQSWVFQSITLNSSVFRVFIFYCDFSHRPTPIFSGSRFIS